MLLSLRKLGLPSNVVSFLPIAEAPELLQDLDLNGRCKNIIVVPDRFASVVTVNAQFSERLKNATAYAA